MSWGTPHSFNKFVDTQLRDLRDRFGMAMWFLVRRRGDEWLALRSMGDGYNLSQGDTMAWSDSLCYRQVRQEGPVICADLELEPSYLRAPITAQYKINAYIGMPLMDQRGELFGTLCAFDPKPQPHLNEKGLQDALHRQCHLLETALIWNLSGLEEQRITDFLEEEGRDPETGLLDAGGWLRILDRERQRCLDYGLHATILRLHGETIERERREQLADSLAALIREHDMAAHLGDGQFVVLLTESSLQKSLSARSRILDALNAKNMWVKCEPEALKLELGVPQPAVLLDGELH